MYSPVASAAIANSNSQKNASIGNSHKIHSILAMRVSSLCLLQLYLPFRSLAGSLSDERQQQHHAPNDDGGDENSVLNALQCSDHFNASCSFAEVRARETYVDRAVLEKPSNRLSIELR
jgi:hypothetical protein